MRWFWRFVLFSWCAAALLGIAGCGYRSTAPKQTMQVPSANVAKEEMKKSAALLSSGTAPALTVSSSSSAISAPPSATSPSPSAAQPAALDERLVLALKHLGAQRCARGEVLHLSDLSFAPGQARFKTGSDTDMAQVVTLLRDYPGVLLIIEGYTDSHGSEQLNDRLSLQRAKSVEQALVADGLKATRLRTRGLGSADPIADNGTQDGRDKNRRVELVFSNSAGTFASAADQVTAG
jgi:outer membrane protein OmpA-like peptidoglycan-associated protein